MDIIDEILYKIDTLNPNDKVIIYKKIRNDLIKTNHKLIDISRYKGIGKNLWNEDPQLFVEKLRDETRD
jgi:hypothetical protein